MDPNVENPLFDDRKEFLERQHLEYRNALRGDVRELRDTSVSIGKKVALVGGALVLTYALTKALKGRNKEQKLLTYKPGKRKKKKLENYDPYEDLSARASAYEGLDISDVEPLVSDMPMRYDAGFDDEEELEDGLDEEQEDTEAKKKTGLHLTDRTFGQEIMSLIKHQVAAYLVILAKQKLEEFLNAKQEPLHYPTEFGTHNASTDPPVGEPAS